MIIVKIVMLVSVCIGVARARRPAQITSVRSEPGRATVYVYRVDFTGMDWWPFRSTFPFYFGKVGIGGHKQRNIAKLREKSYFLMQLEPGTYTFDTRGMHGKLTLDLEAGGQYYLRVEQGRGCEPGFDDPFNNAGCPGITPPSVMRVEPEKALAEMLDAKPIAKGLVKDRGLVIIPKGRPQTVDKTGP